MSDLQAKLLVAFDSEYRSIIETIRQTVTRVEAGAEPASGPALTEAFRMAHTLKGSAHVVGLPAVVTLAHRLESLFARVREGKLSLGPEEIRLVHEALGMVEDIVHAFHQNRPAPDVSALTARLETKITGPSEPAPRPNLAVVPAPSVPAESSAALSTPTAAAAPTVAASVTAGRASAGTMESETVRLPARHLDQLLGTSGELLNLLRGGRRLDRRLGTIGAHVDALAREWELLRRTAGGTLQALGKSHEFARVNQFLDFVGGQLPPLTKNLRNVRAVTKQTDWDFTSLAERLNEDVRRARTVPADSVLGGFHKMMRDLATELGRPFDFRTAGFEVAADRGVLQALKDPLMHMLRNAAGHGLETKDERARAGKDPVGRVTLKLALNHGRLRIELSDDGRGLNEDAIRQRVRAQGLLAPEEAASLPRERLFEYIFHAGFSTAGEITDLSGRGMGMSVVEEALKKLRGTVAIESTPGRGTTFRLSVPVTLSNHHLVMVHVGEESFAIPSGQVESLRRLRRADARVIDGQASVMVDDRPTPVVSLAQILNLPDEGWGEAHRPVVVIRDERRALALRIDGLSETSESLIKNLTADVRALRFFEGAISRGDGSVALVLSARALIDQGVKFRGASAPAKVIPALKPKRTTPARILVVDDSITTRTLERGILEANGYQVTLAVDGVDALAKLNLETYDLIISDVEMPRMDGFTLVSEVKSHERHRMIPVIMVTSLESSIDRERGLALGASAYVAKQKFDQGGLLDVIKGLL